MSRASNAQPRCHGICFHVINIMVAEAAVAGQFEASTFGAGHGAGLGVFGYSPEKKFFTNSLFSMVCENKRCKILIRKGLHSKSCIQRT
jgi:hypothetical protein